MKKKRQTDSDNIIANHMITDSSTSPLYKCTKCPINNSQLRGKYKDANQCIAELTLSRTVNIKVDKSRKSSRLDEAQTLIIQPIANRLHSTPKEIRKALDELNPKTFEPASTSTIYLDPIS